MKFVRRINYKLPKRSKFGMALMMLIFFVANLGFTQNSVVIDHTCTDARKIPQQWIDSVKTMMINIPGESHGRGYMYGLERLGELDTTFKVSITWEGEPAAPSNQHLRAVRSYLRSFTNIERWNGTGGEGQFWTNSDGITMMKNHLTHMRTVRNNPVSAFGFGWCWDMTWHNSPGGAIDPVHSVRWAGSSEGSPSGDMRWGIDDEDNVLTGNSVNLHTYLNTVEQYNSHEPNTTTFYTTGPVDGNHGTEAGYQRFLKHEAIRDYVESNGGILFDYADILCWKNGVQYMDSWNGNHFQNGETSLATGGAAYDKGEGGCHISEEACLLLANATWWMLARIAGWDGIEETGTITLPIPQNFAASNITETAISLQWDALPASYNIQGYKIYRNGIEIWTSNSTNYTDTGLSNATDYTYAISAFDADDNKSIISTAINVTTLGAIQTIPAPQNLIASGINETSVELQWDTLPASYHIQGYKIFRDGEEIETTTINNYTDIGLTPLTAYSYTVSTFDTKNNESDVSNTLDVTTLGDVSIPSPMFSYWNFDEISGSVAMDAIQQTEGILNNQTSWETDQYGAGAVKLNTPADYVDLSNSEFNITNQFTICFWIYIESNTPNYYETVIRKGRYGHPFFIQLYGNNKRIRTYVATQSESNYLTSTSGLNQQQWNHIAMTYQSGTRSIYLNGELEASNSISGNLRLNDEPLMVGDGTSSFNGRVDELKLFNTCLTPQELNQIYNTPPGNVTVLYPPVNLHANNIQENQLTLNWSQPGIISEDFIGYEIYQNGVAIAETNNTSYSISGLESNRGYSFYVVSKNNEGEISLPSETIFVTTLFIDTDPPTQPLNLTSTNVSASSCDLTWSESTDNIAVEGYLVFRNNIEIAFVNSNYFTDNAALPLTSYTYYVIALDTAGNRSIQSDDLIVETPDVINTNNTLINYWDFNEGTGTQALDQINNENGFLQNNCSWQTDQFGGSSVLLNTNADFVNLGNNNLNASNELTISFWLYIEGDTPGYYETLVRKGRYGAPFIIQVYGGARRLRTLLVTQTGKSYLSSNTGFSIHAWNHVVMTYGAGQHSIYINGVYENSNPLSGILKTGNDPITVGFENESFNGRIDDLKIYNKALSTNEISEIYQTQPLIFKSQEFFNSPTFENEQSNFAYALSSSIQIVCEGAYQKAILYNQLGQKVAKTNIIENRGSFNNFNLQKGFYIVELKGLDKSLRFKVTN